MEKVVTVVVSGAVVLLPPTRYQGND
jgi:hypothetical protein